MGDGSYRPSIGVTGLICSITSCKILPDGRALLVGVFTGRFFVTAHWTEENSDNLSYVAGVRELPNGLPWVENLPEPRGAYEAFARAKMSQLVSLVSHAYLDTQAFVLLRCVLCGLADWMLHAGSALFGVGQIACVS